MPTSSAVLLLHVLKIICVLSLRNFFLLKNGSLFESMYFIQMYFKKLCTDYFFYNLLCLVLIRCKGVSFLLLDKMICNLLHVLLSC